MGQSLTCKCGNYEWIIFEDRLLCPKCQHEIFLYQLPKTNASGKERIAIRQANEQIKRESI